VRVLARALPGAEIRSAAGLADALAALAEPTDLVFAAETLADATGVELAEAMRDRGVLTTVILLPRDRADEAVDRALASGIVGRARMPTISELIMDAGQVAAYLALNPRTVRQLARTGRIPAFQVGRRWHFRKSDLDNWIRAGVTGPSET
jgi:excisionase family DNA binding protein